MGRQRSADALASRDDAARDSAAVRPGTTRVDRPIPRATYRLTIHAAETAISAHPDQPAAQRALHRYAVTADLYLHRRADLSPCETYDLIAPGRPGARPAGAAHIDPLPATAAALYYEAGEARRWIAEHRTDTAGYPASVLARAHAATSTEAGLLLWPEAAALAGAEPTAAIDPTVLDALRHHAAALADSTTTTAALAALVADSQPPAAAAATLTWWLALLTWTAAP